MKLTRSFEVNGAAIRYARAVKGISGAALARACGCTASYICQIETRDRQKVNHLMFRKLQLALGVDDPRVLMARPYDIDQQGLAA